MKRVADPLLIAPELEGDAYTAAHAAAADSWFTDLFQERVTDQSGLALVAVGGYGRGHLWPHSDLDVILLHDKRSDISTVAEQLWYPVWDRGLKLGYGVFTPKEAAKLAADELDQATSFLETRLIVGDERLLDSLDRAMAKLWKKQGKDLMAQLSRKVSRRHADVGDVAFKIEPDLKEGRGGLRDLHAMAWGERAIPGFASDMLDDLAAEAAILSTARVALHRTSGRARDQLTFDDQDAVAAELGYESGQEFMYQLALAARRVAWCSDEAWSRWEHGRSRPVRGHPWILLSDQLELLDGRIELRVEVDPASDPLLVLRVAEQAARTDTVIGRRTLEALRGAEVSIPEPWPEEARALFANLLLAGKPAIDVIEDLDEFDLMVRLLPEWDDVRCRPQRNVMHTFTVDRHLCEAAVNAAEDADTVERADLLVVGALLHDIGKGYPGDHTEVGVVKIEEIATRMGYPNAEVAVLADLCRYHLLLPDVAARRDIADPGTIRSVAAAVDSVEFLHLLAGVTRADSKATGPSMWGSWKAERLAQLVKRTAYSLEHGEMLEGDGDEFPTPDLLERMASGEVEVTGERTTLTVTAPDRAGLFGTVAGALATLGLEVLTAAAGSDGNGMAASRFTVQDPASGPVDWVRVCRQVEAALNGRLALAARVTARAAEHGRFRRRLAAAPPRRDVHIDNTISDVATVVDVHAPDTIGLLYYLTRAFAELRLEINSAKVQTLGPDAVDSFYLTREGASITDPELLRELELAVEDVINDQ